MSTQHHVQIRAFGSLQIMTGGAALTLGHRRVKKPLELLRALVAAGPQGATREELCGAVWEQPVQTAYRPLVTTVYRLRRLLGDQEAIVFNDRRVALDGERCWVDAWDFEAALQPQQPFSDATLAALSNYRGVLFEGQFAPYLSALRERCSQLFVTATLQTGHELLAAGQLAAAQLHFENALQFECSFEELFRALIEVLGRRGRAAAADIAYSSCTVAMRRYHGRLPLMDTRLAWEAATAGTALASKIPDFRPAVQAAAPAQASAPGAQPAYA